MSKKNVCHNKIFVTKNILPQKNFCHKKLLSQKSFCHKKILSQKIVVTKKLLSPKAVCHKNSSVIEIFPSLEFASVRSLLFSSLSSLFRMFEASERPAKGPGSGGPHCSEFFFFKVQDFSFSHSSESEQ